MPLLPRMTLRESILFLCCLTALLLLPCRMDAAPTRSTTTPVMAQPLPSGFVVYDADTIAVLSDRLGPFTPTERATAAIRRLQNIAGQRELSIDSLKCVESGSTSIIMISTTTLLSITDLDAAAVGKSHAEYAEEVRVKLAQLLAKQRNETSLKSYIISAILAFISTVLLVIVLKLIHRYFPAILLIINNWRDRYFRDVRIQKIQLLTSDQITQLILFITRIIRTIVVILLIYTYLSIVFSFFPETRGFASSLFSYIIKPFRVFGLALLSYLPNLFVIAVVILISYLINRFSNFIFREIEAGSIVLPGFYSEWSRPTYKIVRFLVVIFSVIVIFPYLPGSDSPAFKGVSIFVGILFSLGSSSAISNIVSGVMLTYSRAFQIGDRVKIGDDVGDVVEKTLLTTRIRTVKNIDITIPNGLVLGTPIHNFSALARQKGLILHTTITIGYDAPWRKVHDLLIAAALDSDGIMAEPKPFVLQTSLDDFYVSYQLNAYTDLPNRMSVTYSSLHSNIQDKFNEGGVEIMSPHYGSHRDGNRTTIPADYLPADYDAPRFRVERKVKFDE